MKGVILAGGLGTRLYPLTEVTNKHLLPVHDMPMLFYPLQMLGDMGVEEVMVVIGGKSTGEIVRLVKDGSQFPGIKRLYYVYQPEEGGIAHALSLAEEFVGGDRLCVVLGDNIHLGNTQQLYANACEKPGYAAHLVLVKVDKPRNYGCVEFGADYVYAGVKWTSIVRIVEKPTNPTSNWAVSGLYFYGPEVFEIIRNLKPSDRGELEISDVNNVYLKNRKYSYTKFDGLWLDAGESIDALQLASKCVAEYNDRVEAEETTET